MHNYGFSVLFHPAVMKSTPLMWTNYVFFYAQLYFTLISTFKYKSKVKTNEVLLQLLCGLKGIGKLLTESKFFTHFFCS